MRELNRLAAVRKRRRGIGCALAFGIAALATVLLWMLW